MAQYTSLTLPSPNLQIVSSEDADDEQRLFNIPILSRRKCVVALYCLICSAYIAVETQQIVSSLQSTRKSQAHVVKITIAPPLSSTSTAVRYRSEYKNESNKNKSTSYASYDSMPALFGRPLKNQNVKARLITNALFEDNDKTLCSSTNYFSADDGRTMEELNTGASVGEAVTPQVLNDHESDNGDGVMCLFDKPVALLVPRGQCSFQAKAMSAVTNPPILQQNKNKDRKCHIPVSYLIIYDDQVEQQQHHRGDVTNNDDKSFPPLIQMKATDSDAKKLKDETPISLLFVSYDTGMALKQAMRIRANDKDAFDGENDDLTITLNPDNSLYQKKHHKSNNDDFIDDNISDDAYSSDPGSEAAVLVQMITAMSLMFTFFVCVGCFMVCCCGRPDEEGFFTIHMNRNGFVFGRPDSGDGEGALRLLTEEEVLAFDEVEFSDVRNSYDGNNIDNYSGHGDELEVGHDKSMEEGNIVNAVETIGNPSSLSDKLLTQGNSTARIDNNNSSSSPSSRTTPLQHPYSSSLNYDSLSWNAMCSICLEDYEKGEKLRMLPCHHMFHTECIVPWLTERFPNCPLCKAQIVLEDAEEVSTTMENREEDVANNIDEEEAMTIEEGSIETDGQSSGISLRNFFFGLSSQPSASNEGVQREILLLEENETTSNLSTPLLQDSISPRRNSSS